MLPFTVTPVPTSYFLFFIVFFSPFIILCHTLPTFFTGMYYMYLTSTQYFLSTQMHSTILVSTYQMYEELPLFLGTRALVVTVYTIHAHRNRSKSQSSLANITVDKSASERGYVGQAPKMLTCTTDYACVHL